MEPENKIGEIFKKTLENYKVDCDGDIWESIDYQLDTIDTNVRKKSFNINFWLKIAASVVLFAGVSFAYTLFFVPFNVSEIIPKNFSKLYYKNNSSENTTILDTTSSNSYLNSENIPTYSHNDNLGKANTVLPEVEKNKDTTNLIESSENDNIDNYQTGQKNVLEKKSETDLLNEPLFRNQDNQVIEGIKSGDNTNHLTEKETLDIEIPNIFTPNGDGYNDYFVIKNLSNNQNQLLITDRNGKVVFEKINYQNDWDGKNLPNGVYYFILKCKYNNQNFIRTGSISIIR